LRWLSWNDGHWAPAVAPFYFEHVIKSQFGLGPPDQALLSAKTADFVRFATVLNGHLSGREHLACGRLTIADFQAASMATHWRQAQMPMNDYPNIVRWLEGLNRLPAWANPWPEE
ncbi:MAG: glutathione S-transferase family protein, partial [Gammaproteobacteria bacterium]|nr:glutathione S-transferase family protein [Gammaproteobacteria bacterium]